MCYVLCRILDFSKDPKDTGSQTALAFSLPLSGMTDLFSDLAADVLQQLLFHSACSELHPASTEALPTIQHSTLLLHTNFLNSKPSNDGSLLACPFAPHSSERRGVPPGLRPWNDPQGESSTCTVTVSFNHRSHAGWMQFWYLSLSLATRR